MQPENQSYLPIGDYHLFYRDRGRGFPILLLHNAAGSASFMNHTSTWCLCDWLVERQYRVIVFDQHGFGQSTPQKEFSSDYFPKNVSDAIALLDHLDLPETVVLGVGAGGVIALNLAIQYPERIVAVIADSAGYRVTEEMIAADTDPDNALPPAWQQLWEEVHGDRAANLSQARARLMQTLTTQETDLYQGRLPEIKCPTLLLSCTGDIYRLAPQNKKMAQIIPDATLKIFRGGDHPVMWSLTRQTAEEIAAFLTLILKKG